MNLLPKPQEVDVTTNSFGDVQTCLDKIDFIIEEKELLSKSTSELIDKCLSQSDEKISIDENLFNILVNENVPLHKPNEDVAVTLTTEEQLVNIAEHSCSVCFHCKLSFDTKNELCKHISETHMEIMNFEPNKHFSMDENHDVEKNSVYELIADKGFICAHCNLIYKNKKDLRNHIIKKHRELNDISTEEEDGINERHDCNKQKRKKIATTVRKREEKKGLRASGNEYYNVKGIKVKERKRRDFICDHCPFKCSTKFNDDQKDRLFKDFWQMGNEDKNQNRQRQYIANHIEQIEPTRQRCGPSRKSRTILYYLENEFERIRVCRSFFLATFDITEKFLRTCLAKKCNTGVIIQPDQRGKQQAKNKTVEMIEQHARQHILSIPCVESHYCRKSSNKLYLSSQLNLEKLYHLYLEKCEVDNKKLTEQNSSSVIKPVSKALYKKYFYSYGNLAFHKPKKDQCNTCNRYYQLSDEEKKAEEENHLKHIRNKDKARELKTEEVNKCKNSEEKRTVLNFDLQAVLECPKGSVSSIFYKRKLAVYNLTIYDLISKEGTCNLWNETEGNRGSTEIGTCLFNYIKSHPKTEHFFLMSDSCGGQNLNQFFTTALLHTVRLTQCKSIDHVFYEPGHSEQEGDSMHSTIERAVKNIQVNVPAEWNTVCKLARKTPKPYDVVTLNHESFIDWTKLAEQNKDTPRYYTTEGELVTWRKIKWFRYEKDSCDTIFFKYNYEDSDFKEIKLLKMKPGRPPVLSTSSELPKAYTSRQPISWEKYKDLKDLCSTRVIPTDFHTFYENLPYKKNTEKKNKCLTTKERVNQLKKKEPEKNKKLNESKVKDRKNTTRKPQKATTKKDKKD